MHSDGRAWNEIQPVCITPGFVEYAEGSVLIEFGGTRVVCNATVEPSVPSWRQGSGAGWVTAEAAPFDWAALEAVVDLAAQGIEQLLGQQARVLEEAREKGR